MFRKAIHVKYKNMAYYHYIRINRSCLANPLNMKEVNFKTREIYFEADLVRGFSIDKAAKIKERLKQPLN